jgi:hypothetical protein
MLCRAKADRRPPVKGRKELAWAEAALGGIFDDRVIWARVGVAVILVRARSGAGIRPFAAVLTVATRSSNAIHGRITRVRQNPRQAKRRRYLKRPAGHQEIERAQNHVG